MPLDGKAVGIQLGRAVVLQRTMRDWTQERLAEAAGLSVSTICDVEAGANCSYATVRKLIAALGVSPCELIPSEMPCDCHGPPGKASRKPRTSP